MRFGASAQPDSIPSPATGSLPSALMMAIISTRIRSPGSTGSRQGAGIWESLLNRLALQRECTPCARCEEKHEIEDVLPRVFAEETDAPFDTARQFVSGVTRDLLEELRDLAGDDRLQYELVRSLLGVEQDFQSMTRRVGIHQRLLDELKKSGYDDREQALEEASRKKEQLDISKGDDLGRIHSHLTNLMENSNF